VRTPAGGGRAVPNKSLARAIAGEWQAQREEIDPQTMPLTQLASTAIDRVVPDPLPVARELACFVETDLLCYRAESPRALAEEQDARWQPLLDWFSDTYGVGLSVTLGVMPVAQSEAARNRTRVILESCDPWRLTGIGLAVPALGSVVTGLALADGQIDAEEALSVSLLDEAFQADRWGEDTDARRRRDALRRDIQAAAEFLSLLPR
jgi:chaperone required for assembly of F1-ATPase